jgi:FkbM family methyltransferase
MPIDLTSPYGVTPRGFHGKNVFVDLQRLAPDAMTVIDVGAYTGDTVEIFRALWPQAEIYALEPTPSTFATLTAAWGSDSRVIPRQVALSDYDGTGVLHEHAEGAANALQPFVATVAALGHPARRPIGTTTVPCQRLDTFCRTAGLTQIDVLKMDAQGSEARILDGAAALLAARAIRVIILEVLFVPRYVGQGEVEDLLTRLRSHGYTVYDWYNFAYDEPTGQVLFGDAIFLPADSVKRPPV